MKPDDFRATRERLNSLTLSKASLVTKRFFNLDSSAYEEGALTHQTKELLGLVASMVLRCDDCICYHLDQCKSAGVTDAELQEALSIALVVGGSIVIPHLRRANEYWAALAE